VSEPLKSKADDVDLGLGGALTSSAAISAAMGPSVRGPGRLREAQSGLFTQLQQPRDA